MLVDALADNLRTLFGAGEYERIRAEVLAGRDAVVRPTLALLRAYADEKRAEARAAPPVARSRAGHSPAIAGLTPIEQHGDVWLKRDDLFEYAGVFGGKVRSALHLATAGGLPEGLVTAGSRASPQVNIVAHIGRELGLPVRAHVPAGALGPEVAAAQAAGAEIVQHRPGYNTVIVARARSDAGARPGWREIPFGMECHAAAAQTAGQVRDLPPGVERIVVPVGSAMTLAGVLWGLRDAGLQTPVLGVVVGADPVRRLEAYAPPDWRGRCVLTRSPLAYETPAPADCLAFRGVALDPIYEAKAVPFLRGGDLFWLVGIRSG